MKKITESGPTRPTRGGGQRRGARARWHINKNTPGLRTKQPAVHVTIPRDNSYAKRPLHSLLFTTAWSLASPAHSGAVRIGGVRAWPTASRLCPSSSQSSAVRRAATSDGARRVTRWRSRVGGASACARARRRTRGACRPRR